MTFQCDRDVFAEAQGTIDTLRDRQAANREGYDEATADGDPTLAGVSEYLGLPMLVVPYVGWDDGDRPLDGRPNRQAPLDSWGLSLVDPDTGAVVEWLRPEQTYELRTEIRNEGDMDVPPTIVEFFATHQPYELHFDTVEDELRLAGEADQQLTGWTTAPPRTKLTFQIRASGAFLREARTAVADDRTFSVAVDLSGAASGDSVSIRHLTPDGDLIEQPVTIVSNPPDARGPIPLSAVTAQAEFVGMRRVRVPAGRKANAAIEYTTPPKADQELGSFFVRAYSVVPLDAPEAWGTLDHRADRHVGRTEAAWQ